MGPLLLATLLRLSPVTLSHWAAEATGQGPDVAERLVGVCYRESRCRAIGLHERDEHIGPIAWGGQTQIHRRGLERGVEDPGHIDPGCQPKTKHGPEGWSQWDWSTHGAWGLQAASQWPYLPRCFHPKILDQPLVSALVAARKWARRCSGELRGWCRARPRRPDLTPVTRSARRVHRAASPR